MIDARHLDLSNVVAFALLPLLLLVSAAAAQTQAGPSGTLKVKVVDEVGQPLPARVHLRDAQGTYLFIAGQSTRQRYVYKGQKPVAGDWFYTDGSFSIEVGPGEAQIDIAHGPAYTTVHDVIAVTAGATVEKTYTLRRMIDLAALGWYSADHHLHERPDAAIMLAEDINLAAIPGCNDAMVHYQPGRQVTQLPDAHHLLVSGFPAVEWDCFIWDLPRPLDVRLGEEDWPKDDGATPTPPAGARGPNGLVPLRNPFLVRNPFIIEQAHAAGATLIAYMHDQPRLWYYPLYVASGWIDVYGVMDNAYCQIANRGSEADFWRTFDGDGFNNNFKIWYRFLNCGYRLPASAGTDNIGMGMGVWKGYNRVYTRLEGPLTVENWLGALKAGRSFVTNRPLLLVTIEGQESGSQFTIKSADAPTLKVDMRVVSATAVSRIEIMHNGQVLKRIDLDPPATDVTRSQSITVSTSGWLAVRCFGLGANPNHSPAFAFAHTSPFYAIVDGRPIRSTEDARWLHDQFSAFVNESLPRVENERIRRILEQKCREALARYAAMAQGL